MLLFTVHVEERHTPDESTWSAFGSVAVRLRPGFHDEFPLMLATGAYVRRVGLVVVLPRRFGDELASLR